MRILTVLARKRSDKFPDVPTVFEAVKLQDRAARLLDWRANIAGLGRVILTTPGTPKERVDYLRTALSAVLRDPAFIGEMKKFNLAAGYLSAQDLEAAVEKAMTTLDANELAEMKDIALNRYYN
jgi:tripartite-type tricarboxylate transporter receptor subunit TctC